MSVVTKALAILEQEFLSVLPPAIFFLISFNIVVLTTSLVLEQFKISIADHASATILALIVGKVVLIVDKIKFVRQFDAMPLVYPILFKAVAYSAFVFLFRLLEYWALSEDIIWRFLAMSQIWTFVLFIVYFTFAELMTALEISARDLARMLFHEHPSHAKDAA